jgi:serine O-acetyltransferase
MSDISADIPDWTRETKPAFAWDPSRSLLASLRDYQRHKSKNSVAGKLLSQVAVLRHRLWTVVTGADIPLNTQIGGGLLLPHPNGVVIHPDARIGPNCLVFQQVTIGSRNGGVPRVGGHVDFGAGAKVLGAISVGSHAVVGANAVVLADVPARACAVGNPARIIPGPSSTPPIDPSP